MIRWVDMVDLRGKPPYLPESKTYTDVLKLAIENAFSYYGFDPETYLETSPEVTGLISDKQKAFPVLKRNVPPAANPVLADVLSGGVAQMTKQGVTTQISQTIPAISISANSFLMQQDENEVSLKDDSDDADNDVVEDEDEDGENLPPKLPMPIGKMNCSLTRTVLAKLIRFHCENQVNETFILTPFR